jgi:integrase
MPSGACVLRYEGPRGVVWRVKYADADGRQVMETVGAERDGVTRKQAESELRERLVKVERRGWRKPAPLTFKTYAERWFEEGPSRRGWKLGTVKEYRSVSHRLVQAFGLMRLAEIRPRHVAAFIADETAEGRAPATISREVSVLHAIFRSAVRAELVDSNPAESAERPKQAPRKWRILEPAEVARVAKAFLDDQARAVFLVLVLTGVRRSEAQALRWRDVDLLEGVLRVRKSKSEAGERSIALSPMLRDVLTEHYKRTAFRGNDELVFCHPERGSAYRPEWFREALTAALTAAGVEVGEGFRPHHDLRHCSLTNGAAAGESPIALMTRAGHSNMATTKRYLHLAGTVFPDEAQRLEDRLLGGGSSTHPSTHLSAPEPVSGDPALRSEAVAEPVDG